MIDYTPFWHTLKSSNESTYTLINKHRISSSTIDKLRKNQFLKSKNNNKPLNTKSNVHSVVRQMLGRLHSLTGLWDRYSLDLIHLIMVSNGTVGIVIASFRECA